MGKCVHEGVKFPCEQCDYKATEKGELLRHMKSIHEGVKFTCEQCDYKATGNGYLLTHIKSIKESINLNKTPQARDPQVKINLSPKDKHCEL